MVGTCPADLDNVSARVATTPVVRGRWVQCRRRNCGFAAAYAGLAVWIVLMLWAVLGELSHDHQAVWLWLAVLLGGLLGLTVRLMVGWARAGVMIAADHVVVRGPWATRRVAHSWIDGFEPGLQHTVVGNATPGVVLRLGDGSRVNVAALGTEAMAWSAAGKVRRWEATAAALNELLPPRGSAGVVA
jgi:hypothetical protein